MRSIKNNRKETVYILKRAKRCDRNIVEAMVQTPGPATTQIMHGVSKPRKAGGGGSILILTTKYEGK